MNSVNYKRSCMEQTEGDDSVFWNEIYLRNERERGIGVTRNSYSRCYFRINLDSTAVKSAPVRRNRK